MKTVIAKRVDEGIADTSEIKELARSGGYEVASEVTQVRSEDAAYELGEGKVEELAQVVEALGAQTVIFDNRLGPYQTYNIASKLPEGVAVIDRFTLILEIFAQRAHTRKAQLQVELAELRYELPRVQAKVSLARRDERPGFMGLGEYDESRERDIRAQISRITSELERIAAGEAEWRTERRESGFDLVALAGYTNAGKSTLLRQLAAELDVDANEDLHPDLDPTAESRDQLFTTLGTTTRRASITDRNVLLTDTVGFINDLPHWLVESFRSTLEQVYHADLVLLVVDVSEPIETIREKLVTCHDTLYERNEAPILTVFNKADAVSDDELEERTAALAALAPDPVVVSATEGTNVEILRERIAEALPPLERERLVLPMTEETMGLVSWIHDNASVDDVEYADDEVTVDFAARPAVVERSRAKASTLATAVAESP